MKVIISDKNRGFLFKHGIYKRMLLPGRHRIFSIFGEKCDQLVATGAVQHAGYLPVIRKDLEFQKQTATVEVPDGSIALHFTDGRLSTALLPGSYTFWDVFEKNTFDIVDITDPETANSLSPYYLSKISSGLYTKIAVPNGEVGILFYDGAFERILEPGTYYFWNYSKKVTAQTVDIRIQQFEVLGQEILTADRVSLRINFAYSCQVTDVKSVITQLSSYKTQLHIYAQLILREFIGKYRLDELLRQKDSIGGQVLAKLQEREGEFFVKFTDAGVKDIILPGEIRDIMNSVLIAEKSAQASVITRREEIASTKSLLDTAKLMDENVTLYKLKELEYLERICDKVGSISLNSGGGIIENLRELIGKKDVPQKGT